MLLRPGVLPSVPPTVEVSSDGSYERGLEALRIAELGGLELDDWQQYVLLRAMMSEGGLWRAFEVALVVGRQNGKSEILIAVILWALFTQLDDPRLTIFAAHEYKTAREIFLRLRGLLDPPPGSHPLMHADPVLLRQVKTIRTANGEESVELENGRRVRFLARTSGSGRGFTGDLVLLDEAYRLNQEQMSALLPTMGARPNPQLWYSSSGPFEDSEVLLSVMARARSDDPGRLAYFGWEAAEDDPVDDPQVWTKCSPAHPHRMSMEQLEAEFRALGREGFAREKLCMRTSRVDRVIPADVWVKSQSPFAAPTGDKLTLAVDMNPEHSQYAVVACDGTSAELVDYEPVSRLVERLTDLVTQHGSRLVLDAAGPAGSLVKDLEEAGVPVDKISGRGLAEACGRLYDGLVDGELKVRADPRWNPVLAAASRKPLGDAWTWSRTRSTGDISPLVALTLAYAAEKPVEVQVMVV